MYLQLTLQWLGRILFMSANYEHDPNYHDSPNMVIKNDHGMKRSSSAILDTYGSDHHVRVTCNGTYDTRYATTVETGEVQTLMDIQMKEMKKSLNHIKSNLIDRDQVEEKARENIRIWRDVALVIDRVFFILYILLIVVSLATLFPRRS